MKKRKSPRKYEKQIKFPLGRENKKKNSPYPVSL